MILRLDREDVDPAHPHLTWGDLYIDGTYFCCTLEDAVRERPFVPVEEWKVKEQTAIPSGIYRMELQDSPHFGPDTPTLLAVPGYDHIRIHGGTTERDTEGCVLVGSRQDRLDGTLHGAKVAQKLGNAVVPPVLDELRAKLKAARGMVHIQVRNGPAWYRDNRITMPAPLP